MSPPSSVPPLPAELILHILELAYPPHAEDDYTGRSHDVLQCCLVSKQWKELTEPVLWRSVTITKSSQVDQLAQQPVEKRYLVRNLALCSLSGSEPLSPMHVRTALNLFPLVVDVRIAGQGDDSELFLSLRDFAGLRDLSSLALTSGVNLQTVDATLPALTALTALRVPQILLDLDPGLLSSATTPALRRLDVQYLEASRPERLLDILDIIEIDGEPAAASDPVFHHPFRNVLVNLDAVVIQRWTRYACFRASLPYPPLHLRLVSSSIPRPALDNIFLLPHRPHSLFLPLLPALATGADDTADVASEAFLKRCKDKGVEVRWYRPASEEWREVGCREFREYVEERKGRAEEQA